MMLDRGTYLVPTLIAPMGVLEAADAASTCRSTRSTRRRMVIDVHARDSIAGRSPPA